MVSSIPSDWEYCSLADVVVLIRNGTSSKQVKENTPYPVTRIETISDGVIDYSSVGYLSKPEPKYLMQHGDILFSHINSIEHVGKVAIYDEDKPLYHGMNLLLIRSDKAIMEPSYLFRILSSAKGRTNARREAKPAINQVSLAQKQVFSLPILLPPLPEQRRIAEVLDAADDAIRQTERVIAKLRQIKQGLLHDLLTRGLGADGNLRDLVAHPEQFKDSALGRIPKTWETTKLIDHFSFPSGQVDPTQEPYRNWPLIAPDHIESATGRLLKIETAAEQNAISGKYVFEPGDVIYSKIRPYLKKATMVNQVGLCSADMYPLHPLETLNSRFLLALILGEDFSRFAIAVSMRSGFPKINRDEMGEYITALPPIEEQRRIAAVLDAHDARIRAEEAVLAKRRQVKRGLMDDLLTGRVRV